MNLVDALKAKYPDSQAWQIGDNADMDNELADLVMKGIKTASCGSLASYLAEKSPPRIGSHNIILDGRDEPVCVIRMTSMRLVRFSDVTKELARKEGEGDLSIKPFLPELAFTLTTWSLSQKNLRSLRSVTGLTMLSAHIKYNSSVAHFLGAITA